MRYDKKAEKKNNHLKQPRNESFIEPAALVFALERLLSQELLFLAINLVLSGKEIRFGSRDASVLETELISDNHDKIQRDTEIPGDEVLVVEVTVALAVGEHVKVLEDSDDGA